MRLSLIVLRFLVIVFLIGYAQNVLSQKQNDIVDVKLILDSTQSFYLNDKLEVGLIGKTFGGETKTTFISLHSTFGWHKYNIYVKNASIIRNHLVYDLQKLHDKDEDIEVVVSPRNNKSLTKKFIVDYNKVEGISVQMTEPVKELIQGQIYEIVINATLSNKTVLYSNDSTPQDGIRPSLFSVFANGERIEDMVFTVPVVDPKINSVEIVAKYLLDSTISDTLMLPVSYSVDAVYDFSAESGVDGKHAVEEEYGGDGSNGESAHPCSVFVDGLDIEGKKLIRCVLVNNTEVVSFVADPYSSFLLVLANGGNGGNGGDGGHGEDGDDETDFSYATWGGNGGNGGNGGEGGQGGDIFFYADSLGSMFLDSIKVENFGGWGGLYGRGGKGGRDGYYTSSENTNIRYPGVGVDGADGFDGENGENGLFFFDGPVSDDKIKSLIASIHNAISATED